MRSRGPLSVLLLALWIVPANAATTAIVVGGFGVVYETSEENAAADVVAYTPMVNHQAALPDAAHPRIYPHTVTRVVVLQSVAPSVWVPRYGWMFAKAAAEGRTEPKTPSSDQSLLEILLPDGRTAWISSANLVPTH